MSHLKDRTDMRNHSSCIHCTNLLEKDNRTRDHVPSKSLLRNPLPSDLPVVFICKNCNNSFSLDEQYLQTLLTAILSESQNPGDWQRTNPDNPLRSQIANARLEYETLSGEKKIFWRPDMKRVESVVTKNARGHVYYEFGEPLYDKPSEISIIPIESMNVRQLEQFNACQDGVNILPEVGSRMLERLIVYAGNAWHPRWIVVQEGVYRYAVYRTDNGTRVKSVIAEYLTTDVFWAD